MIIDVKGVSQSCLSQMFHWQHHTIFYRTPSLTMFYPFSAKKTWLYPPPVDLARSQTNAMEQSWSQDFRRGSYTDHHRALMVSKERGKPTHFKIAWNSIFLRRIYVHGGTYVYIYIYHISGINQSWHNSISMFEKWNTRIINHQMLLLPFSSVMVCYKYGIGGPCTWFTNHFIEGLLSILSYLLQTTNRCVILCI